VLEFSVLGPLRVRSNGTDVDIARPKCRTVLGLLLARANHSVSTGQLIDELWVHEPPNTAASAFRVHIAFLRKTLRAAADTDLITGTAGGYRLSVAPEAVDALQFEAALAQARTAWTTGAAREASTLLERVVTWRRGPAYDDLRELEPLRDEGVRLDNLWLGAVELLADAYLELRRPRDACDLLQPVIVAHPLRESLTERLMLALYRDGRQADAMRAFSALREALDREIGMKPNATVRKLEEAIILQRADLDPVQHDDPRDRFELRESDVFVGRREQLEAIDRAWAQACEQGPRLVLIGGTAGIGKSTLAQQVAQRLAASGTCVVQGACDPEPASDYEPLPQLVRSLVQLAPPALLESRLIGELARLAPDCADRLPAAREPADALAGRHRLFAAVDALLAGMSARTSVLIVAEDLQWSGADALALLRHLLRNAQGAVMVVATYRDDEVADDSPLADLLALARSDRSDVVQLRLTGLDTTELQALVQATALDELRERALARLSELRDVTRGNPLYAREVLRELAEARDEMTIAEVAPDGVRSIVERRLVRISRETRAALAAASVLGREFSLELLALTSRMTEAQALDAVEEALLAGLLDEGEELDQFAFSHPIIRNTIYNTAPASRRARLHTAAARALEAVPGAHGTARAAELARHYLAALPLAAAAFAHEEAATWYGRAIELASDAGWDVGEKAETLMHRGECLERAGRRDEARRVFLEAADEAKAAGDGGLVADIAIAAAPRYITLDEFHTRHADLVDEALATSVSDPRRQAWLLSTAGASHYYEGNRGDEVYAKRAFALARRFSDPEVQAAGLVTYRRWLTHDAVRADERLALSRELMTLCREQRLDRIVGFACRGLLVDLMEAGRLDEFDEQLVEFAALADAHGMPADIYWLNALRATRALMRSPDAYTEELVNAAHTLGNSLQQWDASGTFVLQMFALRYQQDRVREIRAGLEAPQPQSPRVIAGVAVLAAALVACGRAEAARPIVDKVLAGGELQLPHDNLWLGAVALISGTVAEIGTAEQRGLLRRELAPFAERWCIFGAGGAAFGTGHHWLGRLARADGDQVAATQHFDAALARSTAADAEYWAGVAHDDLAKVVELA
jgi:DNA-binding SARP family transcriptional activator